MIAFLATYRWILSRDLSDPDKSYILLFIIFSELATSALQAKIDLFGPDSEKLVDLLILMAESYRALANYDEAEAFLNQVIFLFEMPLFDLFVLFNKKLSCNKIQSSLLRG